MAQNTMNLVNRMSELATRAMDVTKASPDRENYQKEASELLQQYQEVFRQKLNGVALFDVKEGCGSQTIKASFSQSGTHEEVVFEIDTINGAGVAKIDQFAQFIPDLFRVYHGDVLIHERVTGSAALSTFVGGVNSGNLGDVVEYRGNNYKPEPFNDFGEDGVAGTGDDGEGNGEYDYGEPFTDQPSGTKDGVDIFNNNYDGYGPQQSAYLNSQVWTQPEATNPSPGDQPGTRSVIKYGTGGTDVNGNPYETTSTMLRVVINEGGASVSNTDLSPQGTEWEFAIEISPGTAGNKKNIMLDGYGSEMEIKSLEIPVLADIDLSTTAGAQQAIEDLDLIRDCLSASIAQAAAVTQRLSKEEQENEQRIVNVEAASGRIMDVDYSLESTRMAKDQARLNLVTNMYKKAQIIPESLLGLIR